MTEIQVHERHRDFLADLVDHIPSLGYSHGPSGKHVPSGNPLLLLYALLDDYSQSAWTYWGWHIDGKDAPWRASVVSDSALYCQRLLQERHCEKGQEWLPRIQLRHSEIPQALQDWYKRIDYMPESSLYEIGANGEEFPAPPDLIYLIWVALESAEKWARDGGSIFSSDSEEAELSKRWLETFELMGWKLEASLQRAQTGSPPPPKKKRWWQR